MPNCWDISTRIFPPSLCVPLLFNYISALGHKITRCRHHTANDLDDKSSIKSELENITMCAVPESSVVVSKVHVTLPHGAVLNIRSRTYFQLSSPRASFRCSDASLPMWLLRWLYFHIHDAEYFHGHIATAGLDIMRARISICKVLPAHTDIR